MDARLRLAPAVVLAVVALALCAGPAGAGRTPPRGGAQCGINTAYLCVEGGATKLTFRASWLARVRGNGWRMVAIAPAVKRGNVLTMPVVKTGRLTLFRRSRVGGNSTRPPGGECVSDGSLSTIQSAIHHAGGFALLRRGVRRPFDALVLRGNTFYWRGPDHRDGDKGPPSGTFGGVWSGTARIDAPFSFNQGRTIINALRVTEVDTLERGGQLGPVLGVMGSTNTRWRFDPYCQVVQPDPEPPPS